MPRIENDTMNSKQSSRTFLIDGTDERRACTAIFNFSFLLIIRSGRIARMALRALKLLNDAELFESVRFSIYRSAIEITTTRKSIMFHPFLMYGVTPG